MSIPVSIEDLPGVIAGRAAQPFLLTTGADRPRATFATVVVDGGRLVVGVGRRTGENLADHPGVTLLWPPTGDETHALLVDGDAVVEGDAATVTPSSAILHVPRG